MIISISAAAATAKTLVLSRHHFNYAGKKGKNKNQKIDSTGGKSNGLWKIS